MNRKTSLFAGVLLGLTPFLIGQEPQSQPTPHSPEDSLASQQLIAWSRMQNPRPVPEPLPPPDKGIPQPEPQQKQPVPPSADEKTPTQTFTGKIVKDGDKYVLKVANSTSYQLDEQSGAQKYENKDVRVIGTLDTGSNTIRVTKIELLS